MGRAPPSRDSCQQTVRQATAEAGHTGPGSLPGRPQDYWESQGVCDHSKDGRAFPGRRSKRSPVQGRPAEHGAWTPDPRPASTPPSHETGATTNLSHLLTPVVKVILGLTKEPLQPTLAVSGVARPSHAPWTHRAASLSGRSAQADLRPDGPRRAWSRRCPGTAGAGSRHALGLALLKGCGEPPPRSPCSELQGREGTGSAQPAEREMGAGAEERRPGTTGAGVRTGKTEACPTSRPGPEGWAPAGITAASLRPRLVLRSSQAGSRKTTTDALPGATGLWE